MLNKDHFANFAQDWLPRFRQFYQKTLSYGEKIAKIGLVDPEIIHLD